jgi:hypothetical protein
MSVRLTFNFLNVLIQVFLSAMHLNSLLFFSSLRIKGSYTLMKQWVKFMYVC